MARQDTPDCCVCLVSVPLRRAKTFPCGHCLHKGCAVRWLSRSRTCPLCRTAVPLKPSQIMRAAFRRRGVQDLCLDLPSLVRAELGFHPDGSRAITLAFLTADVGQYMAALRGLQL